MGSFAERVLDWIAGLGDVTLHVAAFLLAFSETALFLDLVVPGEAGMAVTGAAAARGDIALPTIVAAAIAGAILGDSVSFLIGRRWGMSLVRRWRPIRVRLEPKVVRAQGFFERHGGAAVFFGRWIGPLRGVVPVVAGTAGMPYRKFLIWNVLASVLWCTTVVSAGYLLGRNIEAVVSRLSLAITVLVVGGLLTWWLVRRRRRARSDPPE